MPKTQLNRNPCMEKYLFHKKTFKIKENKYLHYLEKLIEKKFIECSVKLIDGKEYASRFNIFFSQNENKTAIGIIFKFFDIISKEKGIKLNYSILSALFKDPFDLNKVQQILLGVDFRKKIKESRIKLYFVISDYPSKIKEILKLHGTNKEILKLVDPKNILFGIDFYFGGKTNIKIYTKVPSKSLKNIAFLKKNFKKIYEKQPLIFKRNGPLWVSFKTSNFDRVIGFKSLKGGNLIELLNIKKLNEYEGLLSKKGFKWGYVCIPEKEFDKEKVSNFTLYY